MKPRDGGPEPVDDAGRDDALNRRSFIGAAVAGAVVARNAVISVGDTRAPVAATAQGPAFALDELTIDDLQSRLRSGAETSRSLVQQYLSRIDALDQRGPAINAVSI